MRQTQRSPKRRKKQLNPILLTVGLSLLVLLLAIFSIARGSGWFNARRLSLFPTVSRAGEAAHNVPEWIEQDFIPVDGRSRSGQKLLAVNDIVLHYVGNPGTTARQNRNYFANEDSRVSAHFVIGLEGEIIQCLPLDEISAASNQRNPDTISIEACHPDETGRFNTKTYSAMVRLTAWLLTQHQLDAGQIIRHYDITGKKCPLYFVEHEDSWLQFKADVRAKLTG